MAIETPTSQRGLQDLRKVREDMERDRLQVRREQIELQKQRQQLAAERFKQQAASAQARQQEQLARSAPTPAGPAGQTQREIQLAKQIEELKKKAAEQKQPRGGRGGGGGGGKSKMSPEQKAREKAREQRQTEKEKARERDRYLRNEERNAADPEYEARKNAKTSKEWYAMRDRKQQLINQEKEAKKQLAEQSKKPNSQPQAPDTSSLDALGYKDGKPYNFKTGEYLGSKPDSGAPKPGDKIKRKVDPNDPMGIGDRQLLGFFTRGGRRIPIFARTA